jgi:rod shape-determining protein MreD
MFIVISIAPFLSIFGDKVAILGVKPDIGLVAVYLIGFLYGELDGLIIGIVIGFVMDSFAPSQLGINLLTKSLTGFLAGYLGRVILNPLFNPGIIMALSLLSGVLTLSILQITTGRIIVSGAITGIVLPQAVYDALIGFFICVIFLEKIERGSSLRV